MLLEIGKALSFFVSILSLYRVAIGAFFVPGSVWDDRLATGVYRLAIAACACFTSGLLFTWPAQSNPEAGQPLTSTLPVRLFFWSAAGIGMLFVSTWYLICGAGVGQSCSVAGS